MFEGLVRGLGELDATGLAAASGLHLGLDDGHAAQFLSGRTCSSRLNDLAEGRGDAVLGEEFLRLVLHQSDIHQSFFFSL